LVFHTHEEMYDSGRDVFVFWGSIGISRYDVSSGEKRWTTVSVDSRNELEIFRENRPATEEIAQRKYLTGLAEANGTVLIRTADILH